MRIFRNGKDFLVSLSAFLLLLILAFLLFSSAGRDDVYITYWTSYALSHFGEMINYNGAFVEQSSSLLHVFLLAAANFVTGIKLNLLGPILSLLFAFLTFLKIYKFGKKWNHEVGFLALLFLATSTYFVYWSLSGLESTLMAFLSVSLVYYLALYLTTKQSLRTDFCLFGIVLSFILVRPENLFVVLSIIAGFTVVFLIVYQMRNNERFQKATSKFLLFCGISLSAVLIMILFRYFYFGDIFPQPVFAKSSGLDLSSISSGYRYLMKNFSFGLWELKFLIILASFVLVARLAFLKRKKFNPDFHFFAGVSVFLFVTAYISFIIFSGGDWMEGGRFIAPIMPFFSLLIAYSICKLDIQIKPKIAVTVLLVVLQIGISVRFAAEKSTGMPINQGINFFRNFDDRYKIKDYSWFELTNRIHQRDLPALYYFEKIIDLLKKQKTDKIRVMTLQMGMIPYFLIMEHFGDIEFTDYRGLTDRKFSNCVDEFYLSKSRAGIKIDLAHYLNHKRSFKKICGIKQPDIIYGLGYGNDLDLDKENSYTIIYQQTGKINTGSKVFEGAYVDGSQFIAVKKELLNAVKHFGKVTFDMMQFAPLKK